MTKRNHKRLSRYVRDLADLLGLKDWEIEVSEKPPARKEWLASCRTVPGRRLALLAFRDDFWLAPPENQTATVIHELLHCVHAQTQDQVESLLGSVLEEGVHITFEACWFQAHEYAIDGLAAALAPLLPQIGGRRSRG